MAGVGKRNARGAFLEKLNTVFYVWLVGNG
jgi:hypothetical protein